MYDNWLDRIWNDDVYRIKVAGIILSIALVSIGIWYIFVYRAIVHAEVIDTSWQLQIDRLQYTTLQESDWSVPNGGRLDHKNWEYHYTYTYVSGYHYKTTKGSTYSCGTKKNPRTCRYPDTRTKVNEYSSYPVYDYKYYYYIDRWINIAPLITQGKNKEDVHWPDTTDGTYNDTNIVGNIRLGSRESHFQVIMLANGKTYPIDMVESMWNTYGIGNKAKLTLNFFGSVVAVEHEGW